MNYESDGLRSGRRLLWGRVAPGFRFLIIVTVDPDLDLLVVGGGMAGLTAAARAAQAGARAAVVEKAPGTGGSAISAEFLWSAPTVDAIREAVPHGGPALAERLIERRPQAPGWIEGSEERRGG